MECRLRTKLLPLPWRNQAPFRPRCAHEGPERSESRKAYRARREARSSRDSQKSWSSPACAKLRRSLPGRLALRISPFLTKQIENAGVLYHFASVAKGFDDMC